MLENLKKKLKKDEGVIPFAYQDSLGYWTIGVGHLIDRRKGGELPDHIVELLLEYDIQKHTEELYKALPWVEAIPEVRRSVLICMAFQLGVDGLLKFKRSLAEVKAGNWDRAADYFLESKVAREQTPKRWKRFADQLRKGEWVYE